MPLSPSQLSETGDAISYPLVPEGLLCEPVYVKFDKKINKTSLNRFRMIKYAMCKYYVTRLTVFMIL